MIVSFCHLHVMYDLRLLVCLCVCCVFCCYLSLRVLCVSCYFGALMSSTCACEFALGGRCSRLLRSLCVDVFCYCV